MAFQAYSCLTVRLLGQFLCSSSSSTLTLFTRTLLIRRRFGSEGDGARSVQPVPNKEPAWMTAEEAVSVIKSGRGCVYLFYA